MKRTILVGSCLALTLGVVGCQDQATAPVAARADVTPQLVASGSTGIALPPSAVITDQHLTESPARAIDPTQYSCPASTPISDWWLVEALKIVRQERATYITLFLGGLYADQIPTYEALFFQSPATPQTFGYNGAYTDVMLKTEKDVKRFWDIYSADIQLLAMHGTVLLDAQRTAATYQLFGYTAAQAADSAAKLRNTMLASTTVNGGNHPIFTFNAFAYSDGEGGLPDKIVMGDGILEGYGALGFGDVAPQAIFAHEFAHHIQFENDYFTKDAYATTGDQPERTRYTELMADAMSAYFLTHKRGAAMNRKRVEQFLTVFYQIGDCAFTNDGHHGTPNQRMAAAQFGFDLAAAAQQQGFILTSEQVHTEFVKAYPTLIAPDAPAE